MQESFKLILILSEPDDASGEGLDEPTWRLGLGYSVSSSAVTAVAAEVPENLKKAFQTQFERAQAVWKPLVENAAAVQTWMQTGMWMPTADLLSGDFARDRMLGLSLTAEDVVDLLSHGVEALRAVGVDVMVPRGCTRVQPSVRQSYPRGARPGSGKLGLDQLLDFSIDIALEGHELTEQEQHALLESASNVVQLGGHYVYLDRSALQRARQWISTITGEDTEESLIEGRPK